jgi:hypothetical protein
MPKVNDAHVLSSALDTLVRSPLNHADDVALVNASNEVWYSDSNVESEVKAFLRHHSDDIERRRAAYLLEVQTLMPYQTRHYQAQQHSS